MNDTQIIRHYTPVNGFIDLDDPEQGGKIIRCIDIQMTYVMDDEGLWNLVELATRATTVNRKGEPVEFSRLLHRPVINVYQIDPVILRERRFAEIISAVEEYRPRGPFAV